MEHNNGESVCMLVTVVKSIFILLWFIKVLGITKSAVAEAHSQLIKENISLLALLDPVPSNITETVQQLLELTG